MIIFPTHPDKIQNGSQKKIKGDVEDILIQGYRRSLSDWLIITKKTVVEYKELRDAGLSIKQAIVHNLPRIKNHQVERDICFSSQDVRLLPISLPKLQLRRARIEAWLAKFNKELDDKQRSFLSYTLLTSCYQSFLDNKPWKPTYATLFPHCEVIAPTKEELHLAASISRCNLLERTPQGYFPKKRLEEYFSPSIKKKQVAIHIWLPKLEAIPLPPDTLLTLYRLSLLIKINRTRIRLAWQAKGVSTKGVRTLAEWKILAKQVDSQVSCKLTKGKLINMRGYKR